MKNSILLFTSLLTILISCSSGSGSRQNKIAPLISTDVEGNPYLKKYSGAYTAEIKGKNVTLIDGHLEMYLFTPNGQFKWMIIGQDKAGEAKIDQEQTGRWTATETKIIITTVTNSETFTEEFNLVNGLFEDSKINDRYLKPYATKK